MKHSLYKIKYQNGKECLLEASSDRQKVIWRTESKFSNARIGWFNLNTAIKELKASGAKVRKVIA